MSFYLGPQSSPKQGRRILTNIADGLALDREHIEFTIRDLLLYIAQLESELYCMYAIEGEHNHILMNQQSGMQFTDTQSLCPQGTKKETRERLRVGGIFSNSARCDSCGEVLRSKNIHDFVTCSCGRLSVDGGSWYAKRSFSVEPGAGYTDLTEMYLPDEECK